MQRCSEVSSASLRTRMEALVKRLVVTTVLILIMGLGLASPAQEAKELPPILNFVRIDDQFCTGGQPRLEHLAMLKSQGVKLILNLRTPQEHRAAEEEAKAKELGLKYINIPVVYRDPKEEQATEFLKILDDPSNRPAFIHCTAAIRVGAFWMIRRVLRDGWTVDAAEAEAKKIGLREAPHLIEFAKAYIAKYGKK